jgi:hypothetical protein
MFGKLLLPLMIGTTTVTVLAVAQARSTLPTLNPVNVTVIEKNQVFPVIGPQFYQRCATEDCSDTQK